MIQCIYIGFNYLESAGKSTMLMGIINPTDNFLFNPEQINDWIKIRSIPYGEEICYEEENHDQADGSIGF